MVMSTPKTFVESVVVPFNDNLALKFIQEHETSTPTQPLQREIDPLYLNALVEVLNQYWLTPNFTIQGEDGRPRPLIFKIVHDDLGLDPLAFFKEITGQNYTEASMGLFESAIEFFVSQYR